MTTIHATETMHQAARPARLAVRVAVTVMNAAGNFLRAWKNRRAFYRLGEMSDAELADIGLTRSDLNVVVDLPFVSDPTRHLGAIAAVRQQEIEAMARRVS